MFKKMLNTGATPAEFEEAKAKGEKIVTEDNNHRLIAYVYKGEVFITDYIDISDDEILLQLKIGRTTYNITSNDRFMDNGTCIQLTTQSEEPFILGYRTNPVLSKKAIKELLKFNRIGKSIFNISKEKLAKIEPAAVEILHLKVTPIKNGFYIWHPKDMGSSACHELLLNQVVQVIDGVVWLTGCSGDYSMETAFKFGTFGKCVLTQD